MQTLSSELQARAAKIRLLIMDVDGVLTDGRIFIRDNGEEIKSFHTLDGHGLKMLQNSGVQTAIITGRDAPSVGLRVWRAEARSWPVRVQQGANNAAAMSRLLGAMRYFSRLFRYPIRSMMS